MRRWLASGLLLVATAAQAVVDPMADPGAWQASASDQVKAGLRRDRDGSLCLDADFAGVSGYAVMRREWPVDWPSNFDLVLRARGGGAVNDVQVKLVDASGENVWWVNRSDQALPGALTEWKLRRRHFGFAWGPATDHELRRTRYLEFALVAGREGRRSSLCIASVALVEKPLPPAVWPVPQRRATPSQLEVDWRVPREFNGVALTWPAGRHAIDYTLSASADGRSWRQLRRVKGSDGGLDTLFLPESEARWLRVGWTGHGAAPTLELKSATDWPDRNAVLKAQAATLPRGQLPRAFSGEQNYWTLVGVDGGGARSGLMSEDGALEIGRGGASVEPALRLEDGRLVTWADAEPEATLVEGRLPLPQVRWRAAGLELWVEAAAEGPPEAPLLLARYRVRNTGERPRRVALLLALRPWQVNPPQQFLTTPGGAITLRALGWDGRKLAIQDHPPLLPTRPPEAVQALPFDGGLSLQALHAAPRLKTLVDRQALPSALLSWTFDLAPGAEQSVGWTSPLGPRAQAMPVRDLDARFAAAAARWRERLSRLQLRAGPDAAPLAATLATSLSHMLVSRDGPALRPGTRSYARTWIRDGAMMVAALLRLGEHAVARDFVDDFAGRIFESGKVPCCVDARGADPVAENDSHGQYLYAVAEVWRHTRNDAWLARHWPHVQRVVAYLEQLRQSERGEKNRVPERAHLFGLLPPSISHEGYSDKPAYSYWDDFWALRGYKDAVSMARTLGHDEEAARWAGWRDEFEREFMASVAATAARFNIDYLAGAADRGDFDATSSTVAFDPAQAAALPPGLLEATFERYWTWAQDRAQGRQPWKDYTPYELRTVGALLRLGRPERAHAMLDFFFGHQRPAGWRQWAEVVLPDARAPRFLGDMPHAWVSSDYVRSALDLFAWEREADDTLVVGAGWKPAWRDAGITLTGLSTRFGRVDLQLAPRPGGWRFEGPRLARGRAVLAWAGAGPLPRASAEGHVLEWQGRELPLPPGGAAIELDRPEADKP